ncbi:hypothetical protein OH492_07575 [Vibrio chagasii]|nr:hypothetical protein [Vibrio chagasii]
MRPGELKRYIINSHKNRWMNRLRYYGLNQIVLRMDTMLGEGAARVQLQFLAPFIFYLDVNGGELEIEGPKLNDVLPSKESV